MVWSLLYHSTRSWHNLMLGITECLIHPICFHFPLKFHTKCVCSWWYSVIFTIYHAFAGLLECISIVIVVLGCCHFTLLCLCHAYQSVLWVIFFFFFPKVTVTPLVKKKNSLLLWNIYVYYPVLHSSQCIWSQLEAEPLYPFECPL